MTLKNENGLVWLFVAVVVAMLIIAGIMWAMWETKESDRPCTKVVEEYLNEVREKTVFTLEGVTVYAYCPCAKCNTRKWAGMVSTGHTMKYFTDRGKRICAVDPTVIPLWSIVEYDGEAYLAVDVGSSIKGNKIDILLPTHEDTIKFGVEEDQTIIIRPADEESRY